MTWEQERQAFLEKEAPVEALRKKIVGSTFLAMSFLAVAIIDNSTSVLLVLLGYLTIICNMTFFAKCLFKNSAFIKAVVYIFWCAISTFINPYLGLLFILVGYANFARIHRAQARLSNDFRHAINNDLYVFLITSMIITIGLTICYTFSIQ